MKTFLRAAALATLFAASTLFILFAAHAPRASAQDANQSARQRITVASGARVRERPDTGAGELARLQLGVVVDELERSPEKSKVGAAEDYWYQVSAPGGVKGWVFGSLTAPFDSSRREEIYRRIADERLASSAATFAELADLVRFLDRATKEVTQRDALAELEFARLQALARSLSVIPFEQHETSPYKDWTTERADEIVYNEPSGQWYVRAELLWNLQKKYGDLPVGERIGWVAAQTPLPGECEGDLACTLFYESATNGQYLKLYPHGAHAENALNLLGETFDAVVKDFQGDNPVYQITPDERADFKKTLATLRAQLTPAASAQSARVLKQLGEIEQHFH
ncbi:MAG TPA: SH3 domain-containing protein [Pyrinomonadaceae bacterium]|nr:SH3 domain-containing protein [Pyrinomonadaceae bacterium]